MAAQEEWKDSVRIGDTVLFFVKEGHGYVCSQLASSHHNTVSLFQVDTQKGATVKDPILPNVHFATFKVVAANKYKSQERLNDLKKRFCAGGKEPGAAEQGLLLQAQKNLDAELKENDAEQERLSSSALVYGDTIQLHHVLTKKYLCVSTTTTSRTENTSLKVELLGENAEGCIFRILPRYKVRSVGDEVRYDDQVKLESVKTEGQFLHCSVKTLCRVGFLTSVLNSCHELNLSATESALTVIQHYHPVPRDSNAFRGGASVRLFHREYECYVSAEGSFAEHPAVVEDVHCRKRSSDHGILKSPSTSANVYWQFERESDPRNGAPLSWGERVRIKHMPTRQYLSVVKGMDGKFLVKLQDRSDRTNRSASLATSSLMSSTLRAAAEFDTSTVFSLHPVIKEEDTILLESYTRIKHLKTNTWLHLEKGHPYVRKAFDPSAPGLDGLEWDGAELFMLEATETMNYDDAFTLEQVEEDLLDKFNYVAGIVPVLTDHITEREVAAGRQLLSPRASYSVSSALTELAEFLTAPTSPRESKNRQKLLRNLRILELVIRILGFFKPRKDGTDEDAEDITEQREVCKAGYLVIESYLKGDSRKNENYLARFIPFFQKQVRMDLNAEEVMIEMVEDNDAIVSKMAEIGIDFMIKQFVETRDPRFLDFLGNLCVCDDKPIPSTQNAILNKLVYPHGEAVFYQTKVFYEEEEPAHEAREGLQVKLVEEGEPPEQRRRATVYFRDPGDPGGKVEWTRLANIAGKDVPEGNEKCEFLVSQLKLFGKMCKGRNTFTIGALDQDGLGYVTFDEAELCVRDGSLQPCVQSMYVDLITVMFVDVGKNRNVLENLSLSFIYENVVEDPYEDTGGEGGSTIALTGVENIYFPRMRDWIKDHLAAAAEKHVIATETEENELLAKVLGVLALLVKYGYYDDEDDVDRVLRPIISLLNGFNDLPYPASEQPPSHQAGVTDPVEHFQKKERFMETEKNLAIFAIKERAIDVLDLFFNFRFYVRLQRFIYDFRVLKGDVDVQEGAAAKSPKPFNRILSAAAALGTAVSRPPHDLADFQFPDMEILQNPALVQIARERLRFIFSQSAYFFEKPEYIHSDKPSFQDILLDLSCYECENLVQGSLHLLNRFYSTETTLFLKAIQTQLLVTDDSKYTFGVIEEKLPIMRQLMSIDAGDSERRELTGILRTFTQLCELEGSEEPHPQNQKILYNYGILADVLNYVLRNAKSTALQASTAAMPADPEQPKLKIQLTPGGRRKTMRERASTSCSKESVFVECFKFLKAFAHSNLEVQRRLYDRMDDLLNIDMAIPDVADLLTELYTGGPEISLKVKEEEVERIFRRIATGGEEGQAELVVALEAMVKDEELDLPVKRNQAYIIKYFSKTREKFCDRILGEGRDKRRYRWKLLMEGDEDDPDLKLLLTMTDLLASCSEGENLFIESVCQTVFSVEELLQILSDKLLPHDRKRPFARFLVWVYLHTGGDKITSGASELTNKTEMWDYLEHVADLLDSIWRVLRALPEEEQPFVREGLTQRHYSTSMKQRPRAPRASQVLPLVTGEDGNLKSGVLVYFSDGVLPLLKSFFHEFFDPPRNEGEERTRQIKISSDILDAMLNLSEVLLNHFDQDAQVKLYRSTVITIMWKGQGVVEHSVAQSVVTNFNVKTTHCEAASSQIRLDYDKKYLQELKLNDTFNTFVGNFRVAYEGPNTVQAQIGAKFDTPYSDFEDEDEPKPKKRGDEYLPLGPSFQEHVSCFAYRHTTFVGRKRIVKCTVKPNTERLLTQLEISFRKLEEDLSESERQRQDQVDIKCLQILRAIIHNEIMHIDPDLKENSPERFRRRCVARLHPLQSRIQDFGNAVARVVPILSHPNDEIVREVLAFLKALMFSGNHHVQQGMKYLLVTREERLFSTMRNLFLDSAITHKERKALLMQVEARIAAETTLEDVFKSLAAGGDKKGERRNVSWKDGKEVVVQIDMSTGATEPPGLKTESIPLQRLGATDIDAPLIPASPAHPAQPESLKRRRISTKPFLDIVDSLTAGTLASRPGADGKTTIKYDPYAGIEAKTAELLRFQDTAHIRLALKVLGLMCDGQYRLMQNYLREQKDNLHTVNIVGEVALFLQNFHNDINKETMELVHLILQTLIELCVGNYPNQEVIFNRQIMDALNRILQLDIRDTERLGYTIEDSVNLKGSAVELVEAMLEETSEKTRDLVLEIVGVLDIGALHDTLLDFYELMNDSEVKAAGFDDEAERGLFRTYHILVHLTDYPGITMEKVAPMGEDEGHEEVRKAWKFCEHRTKSMEVLYKNQYGDKILTRIHFQFDPVNELREEVVEKVKWNINRDSPEDKLRDFLEWMFAVKRDTIHHNWLHRHLTTRGLIQFPIARYYILLFLSILMNILLLVAYRLPENEIVNPPDDVRLRDTAGGILPDEDYRSWFFDVVLYVFGAFHLIFSLWMFLEYFVVNWPNFVLHSFFYKIVRLKHQTTYSDINIFGLRTLYVVVFLLASIFSLPYDGYFYSFCLLHIVINNDILQRVLRSVTKNGVALLWVAALGFVVLYIYAVVSFAFLHESFLNVDQQDDGTLFCNTLFQCLISTIRYGLIDNLGLIVPLTPDIWETAGVRLLYDISFFIIITTIGLNIVFGIIVDTFSELRDERYRTEQDKKAVCFICSLPSHEFERRATGFDNHVKFDHNMWNYIYYSIYLDHIDTSDHNAIESFVYKSLKNDQPDFFPLLQALVLEKDEDETAQQLDELKAMVQDVLVRFRAEEHSKAVQGKLREQEEWEKRNLGNVGERIPSVSYDPPTETPQMSFDSSEP